MLIYYSWQEKKCLNVIHLKPLKLGDNPRPGGVCPGRLWDVSAIVYPSEVNMVEPLLHMYVNLPNLTSTNVLRARKGFNTTT